MRDLFEGKKFNGVVHRGIQRTTAPGGRKQPEGQIEWTPFPKVRFVAGMPCHKTSKPRKGRLMEGVSYGH